VGIYLALTIPVAVFPDTNFPRIVIGADNGVFPIDQMLVTVTKPLEEAVNIVPGLDHLYSITSRGTAEIDLFFNWNADMNRTLELVNAALARVQPTLPSTVQAHGANRLTFAAFPDHGLQPDVGFDSANHALGMATYDIKPRLNRRTGVSQIVVQGGQVPEFEVQPDPAKLVQAGVTVPNILDAIGRSNMIDSPGLIEANHQLVLSLVSGQTKTRRDRQHRGPTTPAGAPIRIADVAKCILR
jgi:multidrug efflux pump subunit AcrB